MVQIAEPGQLERCGKLRQAKRGYRRLMFNEVRSVRAAAAVSLGFLYERAGRPNKCVEAWQRAARTGDLDLAPYAWLQLGCLYEANSQFHAASGCYIEPARSGNAEHAPLAALRLALVYRQEGSESVGIRSLLQWVVASGHPDAAPAAAQYLADANPG